MEEDETPKEDVRLPPFNPVQIADDLIAAWDREFERRQAAPPRYNRIVMPKG